MFRSPYGLEGKYFTTSAQQAARYAREAVKAFGDAPYTIVRAHALQSLLETPGMSATIEKGIQAYHVPNQALPEYDLKSSTTPLFHRNSYENRPRKAATITDHQRR
jgi:hypothetical protein